ncbi:misacylated tRNA(Ala) deacylase [Kushneria sinocarnis]|uniref:Alanine--tRNA ligase n=1 Tax=Kushneria sinocarnis TaxID=595502 RepID=A0A420X0A0_9GAMM|nr:alanyl-tRNA editing protein [Kushneria sinocarnis]RKR07204.1 misacylated tRNA(Ala) deacylase [Kushneria sinocarnis]
MATLLHFRDHPYQCQLEAIVTAVDETGVVTDRTLFYPMGGGQPGDTGIFATADGRSLAVTDTRKGEVRDVVHQLAPGHGLQPGDRLTQQLDWSRRWAHMRMHSALHLLSVAVPRGVTGGSIGADRGRLDFDLGELTLDKGELSERLNALVAEDHPITSEWISEAELDARPELVKTMSVTPPRGAGEIRMVRIGGIDYQPCGGTHVASTGEIGVLEVAGIKNRGARNRRIILRFTEPAGGGQP